MNDEMPWVNLTQDEVNELRDKKHTLTDYGKQRLKELMEKQSITATVSTEDYNKVVNAINQKQLTHEEMLEIAEEREKLNAGFKKDENGNWYRPTLEELSKNERIELAEKEITYMVMGGQDGREYANSIAFLLQVLDSLKDE